MASEISQKLKPGLEGRFERAVPFEWTIAHWDARLPAVFSTPAMIGMMEAASSIAVQPALAEGTITVGTRIEVDHLKAVGAKTVVTALARLTDINGRILGFDVEARAGELLIGQGRVYRAIVDIGRFHEKAGQTPSTK
jgi:fluoroacetyl-CoA thioesterase